MIDREKVIKAIEKAKKQSEEYAQDRIIVPFKEADMILALLKEQEVVSGHWLDDTGHWIEGDRNGTDPHARTTGEMVNTFRCSWCGFYQYWKTPFCPNCGAKME